MKHYSIGEFAKLINRTPQTLRNWDKDNALKLHHVAEASSKFKNKNIYERTFDALYALCYIKHIK